MYDEMAIVVGKDLVTGNYFAGHVDMEEPGVSLEDDYIILREYIKCVLPPFT